MQINSSRIHDYCENDQRRQSTSVVLEGIMGRSVRIWEEGGGLPLGLGIKTVNKDTKRRWVAFVPEQKQWEMIRRACGCQFVGHRIINKISLTGSLQHPISRSIPTRALAAPVPTLEFIPTSPVATSEQNTTNFMTVKPACPASTSSTYRPPLFVMYVCVDINIYMYKYFSPALFRKFIDVR